MRYLSAPILSALLLVLSGCPVNLDTAQYPTSRPAASDLPGVYRPTVETTKLNTQTGKYVGSGGWIELRFDGTFTFHDIPDWWRTDFGKPAGGFDNGSGTWKVVKHQSWWALELDFRDRKAFATPDNGGLTTEANLIGQKAPYDIALTVGDPDEGREMRFARESLATGAKNERGN